MHKGFNHPYIASKCSTYLIGRNVIFGFVGFANVAAGLGTIECSRGSKNGTDPAASHAAETEPSSRGGDDGTSEDDEGPAASHAAGLGTIKLRDGRDDKHPAAHNVAGLGTIECRGGDSSSKDGTGPAALHAAGRETMVLMRIMKVVWKMGYY
ncbi:hypothetical protein CVT25_008494 [Psilocybe cyanescens]|uniref:Uncharacterized protein n=1 Tax=Psilocybe cyanescens TaxID=93625 RepID=A0A409XRY9_PSICY|nr:hypothetical protein CVT25_008494 [Psilocybe cyanescens]